MLGMLPPECKSDWKGIMGALVHAYNFTQNSAMGFSSYFLMYGRQTQLHIDITIRLTPKLITMSTSTKYIQKLRVALGGPTERLNYSNRRRHGTINIIMINKARQCPWGWETWSWSVSLLPRADAKSRVVERTGSMWWSCRPIQTCQCLWYVP